MNKLTWLVVVFGLYALGFWSVRVADQRTGKLHAYQGGTLHER